MGSSPIYNIVAILIVLLALIAQLDKNKRRSRVVLLVALGTFVACLVLWWLDLASVLQ